MKFDESKVINELHPEKAEVGKKYWFADSLLDLKRMVEKEYKTTISSLFGFGTLEGINEGFRNPFVIFSQKKYLYDYQFGGATSFLYPFEENKKKQVSNE